MTKVGFLGGVSARAMIGPMTAAERAKGRYMRAPDGHSGGGAGGAADLLDDPNTGGGDQGGGGGGDQGNQGGGDQGAGGGGDQGNQGGGDQGALPSWATGVSTTTGENESASNADWLKSKGFKDIDGLVKAYRDTERAYHDKGAVKIPGEGAKPEEIAAFRKATGVPDKAEEYEVELPDLGEGAEKLELDTAFLDPMKALAHKAGMSKQAFKEMASGFVQHQLDSMGNAVKAQDDERDALFKEWGPSKDTKLAEFRQGAKLLGLDRNAVAAWQSSAGSRFVLERLADLGSKVSEDLLAGDGNAAKYGVATEEDAQKQIDAMIGDKDVSAKLKAKDPATVAKWNRLNSAVASFRASKAGKK